METGKDQSIAELGDQVPQLAAGDEPSHNHSTKSERPISIEVEYNGQPRQFRIQHGSHWDTLSNHNPWMYRNDAGWTSQNWWNDWMWEGDESHSFEKLAEDPRTSRSLEQLANLSRENAQIFITEMDCDINIPLFKDPERGDEYLLNLSRVLSLPRITCTSTSAENVESAKSLYLLQGRQAPSSELQSRAPKHVIQLGSLYVRTLNERSLEIFEEEEPVTERTDWNIMLDAEDDNLSMWLVTSRQQVKDHIINAGAIDPILPLPIFRSLMSDENNDYDCACFFDSVNRLGLANPNAPTFSEILDRIRDTRRIMDPICSPLPRDQLEKYVANQPFDHEEPAQWPVDPNLEAKITALLPHEREMR